MRADPHDIGGMDTAPIPGNAPSETARDGDATRSIMHAWEAEQIAEADTDITVGRVVNSAKVKAWIDSVGTDHELPIPYSGR